MSDPKRIVEVARRFGMTLATDAEIVAARAIAARLIGAGIAAADTFIAMQTLTESSVFVFCESDRVTGMLGMFLLSDRGLDAIERGVFDGITPDRDHVCQPYATPVGCYGWGFAAATEQGGRAAVKAAVALHDELFWAIPTFTRTATPDGVRVIRGSMGYEIYRETDPTLVWIPPRAPSPSVRR
ncbi:MAG: hypothetical protein JSS00_03170 [Proteobacteria bacterium]|nr:hypothetical protein [Pseudomonadota bacterium]